MKTIHERLLKYQKDHKQTQQQMAKLLGVSQTTYFNWTNRVTDVSFKYFPIVAKICKIDIGDLIPPNATIGISNGVSNENPTVVNAKEIYEDFIVHLKDANQLLKAENEALKKRVVELEGLLPR